MNANTSGSLSPLKAARRDKILEYAEQLFVLNGLRATTMEDVATAVDMSKVTVYGYFSNKDALFAAVAERLAQRLRAAVVIAMGNSDQPEQCIANALVAKHRIIFEVVRSSAYASELLAAKNQHVAGLVQELDDEIERLISEKLVLSGYSPDKAISIAGLLFGASAGIATHADNANEMEQNIVRLVEAILVNHQI